MKKFILIVLLLYVPVAIMAQIPVKKIPEFVFYRLSKKSFTKGDISPGKKIFFMFFDSGCDHCQHAMQKINSHYTRFSKTEVYLITLDNANKISDFLSIYGPALIDKPNVTILQDLKNEFIADFNPRKYPSMFLFSAKGNLLVYQDDPENMSQIFKLL